MQFCPHCMKPAAGAVCGECGGDMNWKAPASQLPLGAQLRGQSGNIYSIDELRTTAKVSKSVMELLEKNGALKGMSKTNQLSMFG